MNLIETFDFPIWQFGVVVSVGVVLMFYMGYNLPSIKPDVFFSGITADQPLFVMKDNIFINASAVGQIISMGAVFSWMLFRTRIASIFKRQETGK